MGWTFQSFRLIQIRISGEKAEVVGIVVDVVYTQVITHSNKFKNMSYGINAQ